MDKQIIANVSTEMLADVDEVAEEEEVSRSEAVRRLISAGLEARKTTSARASKSAAKAGTR